MNRYNSYINHLMRNSSLQYMSDYSDDIQYGGETSVIEGPNGGFPPIIEVSDETIVNKYRNISTDDTPSRREYTDEDNVLMKDILTKKKRTIDYIPVIKSDRQ